jgi:uncharacterized membrane protein
VSYNSLPATIAVHFDLLGKPNGYRLKTNIWFAPTLFTLLSIGFILGGKHQEIITFPKRKLSNMEKKSNLKIMLLSALLLAVLCAIMLYLIIQASVVKNFDMPYLMFMILGIIAIYISLIFYYKFALLKS